jgi:chloride channel protein, CIC family
VTTRLDPPRTSAGGPLQEGLALARHMLLVAAPLGAVVGLAIAGYDWVVNELLWSRITARPLAVQLVAPLVGLLLTGLLLRLFRTPSSAMADEVVRAYHEPGEGMPTGTAPGKLAASIATMGLGGSAGMEGASKWLGATVGSFVQGALNRLGVPVLRWSTKTALLVGGSAGIAAIFRAPLSGAIMGVESPYKHDLAHEALLPALVASATSFFTFAQLRPATPYFPATFHYVLDARDLAVAVPLGLLAGLSSHLFLRTLSGLRGGLERLAPSIVLRTTLGGALLVALAAAAHGLVGAPVTLGAGLPVANALLAGKYALWGALAIFGLKLLATAVTFGCGGVGGLFVPSATMGAALGAAFDAVLSPSHPGVFTLLGIAAFTGASYNSILFAVVFVAEATGNVQLVVPSLVASTVAFAVAAGVSNSRAQRARRPDWQERLRAAPVSGAMTTGVITAAPGQPLDAFARAVLLEHHFKALPVVDGQGTLLGMAGLAGLRRVPQGDWGSATVADILDATAPTLGAGQSVAEAEELLRDGPYDYLPVVDPGSRRLVGVVSATDVYRALAAGPGRAG